MTRSARYSREPDNLLPMLLIMGGMGYYMWRSGIFSPKGTTPQGQTFDVSQVPVIGPILKLIPPITLSPGTYIPPQDLPISQGGTPTGSNLPRGIRNNNPLNIEYHAGNTLLGQIGTDGRFAKFSSAFFGLRAAFNLLGTYHTKYGANTIYDIVSRWAPATENNVGAYAANVASVAGISPLAVVNFYNGEEMAKIVKGMIAVENGAAYANYYSMPELIAAWLA